MKCPHCDQELKADMTAFYNVETYGKSAVARTMCCERLVTISRVTTFRVSKYEGQEKDDWGR